MIWDFSRYNVLVKQVEGCSDILAGVLDQVTAASRSDARARLIVRKMRRAMESLDRSALEMLAVYDPAAVAMLAAGVKRDPRRGRPARPASADSGALPQLRRIGGRV